MSDNSAEPSYSDGARSVAWGHRLLVVAAAAGMVLIGACSQDDPDTETAATPSSGSLLEVTLTMDPVVNDDGTVSVTAESNLPEGTELGATVSQEGGYVGHDSAVLEGGAAAFGPFSDQGGPISPGRYEVSVTMPLARNQPDDVRAVIGDTGENLTGPLVSDESITGDAVVSVSDQLIVP